MQKILQDNCNSSVSFLVALSLFSILIFLLFVLPSARAQDYGSEYANTSDSWKTESMTLDGHPYLMYFYSDSIVIYDLVTNKPLFDKADEKALITVAFQQEYYKEKYVGLSRSYFGNLLSTNLDLDSSLACQVIDFDKVLVDKAITLSQDYGIKNYIPKKCVDAPLNCKELAKDIKSAVNKLAKIDNYVTPQIILAIYCKGEESLIVRNIIEPAKRIDSITQNIQNRAYLTGQVEQLIDAKTALDLQLSYGKSVWDFGRDAYFTMKETGAFLQKTVVQAGNIIKSGWNGAVGVLGLNLSVDLTKEPDYWSQKLSTTRSLAADKYTSGDVGESRLYADRNAQISIKKLDALKDRNEKLIAILEQDLGNYWTDWLPSYLNWFIYDYSASHISDAYEAKRLLKRGIAEHESYLFNTAYKTLTESQNSIQLAQDKQIDAEKTKTVSFPKIIIIIILLALIIYLANRRIGLYS